MNIKKKKEGGEKERERWITGLIGRYLRGRRKGRKGERERGRKGERRGRERGRKI